MKTNVLCYWYYNYEFKHFLYLIVFQSISVNAFPLQNVFIHSVIISVLYTHFSWGKKHMVWTCELVWHSGKQAG